MQFIELTYETVTKNAFESEKFNSLKSHLVSRFENGSLTLHDFPTIYREKITNPDFAFPIDHENAESITNLSFTNFVEFFENYLLGNGKKRRLLSL